MHTQTQTQGSRQKLRILLKSLGLSGKFSTDVRKGGAKYFCVEHTDTNFDTTLLSKFEGLEVKYATKTGAKTA